MTEYKENKLDSVISRTYKGMEKATKHTPIEDAWFQLEKKLLKSKAKTKRHQFVLPRIAALVFGFACLIGAFFVFLPATVQDVGNYLFNKTPVSILAQKETEDSDVSLSDNDRDGVQPKMRVFTGAAPASENLDQGLSAFSADSEVLPDESIQENSVHKGELTFEEAVNAAPFKVKTPEYLPKGIVLETVLLDPVDSDRRVVVTMCYSDGDGSKWLCISQQNILEAPNQLEGEVVINGYPGQLVAGEENLNGLHWIDEDLGVVVNIEGELTIDEVLKVANSLKP